MKTIFNGENNYDLFYLLKLLYGKDHSKSKDLLKKTLHIYHSEDFKISFFSAGRCALFKLLVSLNYKQTFNVGLQAFTCSVVPKAIMDAGGTPVYLDLEIETLSIDYKKLEKIINKLDVVILQYTFGFTPKYLKAIVNLCKKNSKTIILDKAHCMPEVPNNEIYDLESSAYGIFYSTDHTKAINAVRGGICLSKKELYLSSDNPKEVKINIPFIFESIFYRERLYFFARVISFLMRILSISYMPKDNSDIAELSNYICNPSWYSLVLDQIFKADERSLSIKNLSRTIEDFINNNQNAISLKSINSVSTPLRVPILFKSKKRKEQFIKALIKENIKLSDWFGGVLTCRKDEYKKYNYSLGDCPLAEEISQRVIGIPCNKRFRDKRFTSKLNKVLKKLF